MAQRKARLDKKINCYQVKRAINRIKEPISLQDTSIAPMVFNGAYRAELFNSWVEPHADKGTKARANCCNGSCSVP